MLFDTAGSDELLSRHYKLAFFDIDGTLLGLDGNYSQRVKDAVLALRQAGIRTAVASGRPRFAADFLIDQLQLRDAGLFYTGALVQEPAGDVLALHSLDDDIVQALVMNGREQGLYTEVCGLNEFFVDQLTELGMLHAEHLRVTPVETDLLALRGRFPVIKILFAAHNAEEQLRLQALEQKFPQLVFAYAKMAAKPDWLFASVISGAACKQQAFDLLLAYHGVSADEVMSFGDAQSDMIFLQRAGLGVALGNAAPEVQAVASMVTSPVWEDGVAEVIERHLQLR
ncbi:HAD hydrolase family protein [Pseudomaricurvus sp. HS19]|uniref:HAD hydrolase family protein n=1 Tax=Pseudomaricurvus sp. HS19 TaxID=2692626 RepID=UPI001370CA09|nr:HAD hydrolase family protein [Pseudomaricurvus sp. HS19]MYM62109.1 HAD hydrolase family protein [Pseudomaricurvus sp. HS19]